MILGMPDDLEFGSSLVRVHLNYDLPGLSHGAVAPVKVRIEEIRCLRGEHPHNIMAAILITVILVILMLTHVAWTGGLQLPGLHPSTACLCSCFWVVATVSLSIGTW
jgi:hypothetical protein